MSRISWSVASLDHPGMVADSPIALPPSRSNR